MTKKEREDLLDKIDNEGFEYFFCSYSSCDEIKDKKFHKLRKAFVDAQDALEKYINNEEN